VAQAEQKSFTAADETRTFAHGKMDLLQIGGSEIGRLTLEPGWRWSDDVKPIAGTELCEAPHFQYHVAGRLHVLMADGTEFDAGPGDRPAPGTRRLGGGRRGGRPGRLVGGVQLRQGVDPLGPRRDAQRRAPYQSPSESPVTRS